MNVWQRWSFLDPQGLHPRRAILLPYLCRPQPRQIATDDDYALYSVVIFKKVHDEFAQKLRENKYVVFQLVSVIY